MVSFIFCSAVSFFAVFGVYLLAVEIFKSNLCLDPQNITLCVKDCENEIEYTLRTLLFSYPKSIITVEDINSDDNTMYIVKRLSEKHNRIHIKSETD